MGMMLTPYFLYYLLICLVTAAIGYNRKLGFWGYFFASILLTPLIGLLLVIVSSKNPVRS